MNYGYVGTTAFDPQIDDIVEEAYERCYSRLIVVMTYVVQEEVTLYFLSGVIEVFIFGK